MLWSPHMKRNAMPSTPEYIAALRSRAEDALRHLLEARESGDRAKVKAWETAFRRINMLRFKAGDDMNS
jgi:hypothetical protein